MKSNFRDRDHTFAMRVYGTFNAHHVLNLFELYRHEREHPPRPVLTDRYRKWLSQRDGAPQE